MAGARSIAADTLPEGFTLLQVTPRLEGGGVERVTLDISAAVARAGGRALTASWGGALEAELAAGGGALRRLPVHRRDPLTLATNIWRLRALIRREGVSLVHVRSRGPAFSAISAARWAGTPVVATYHGIYGARGPLKRWYNGVMTRGDLTIANSRFTRDHVIAEHGVAPDRLVVVPEGIDTARFDPAAVSPARIAAIRQAWGLGPESGPVILLAARLTGWKGQELGIEALARLSGHDGATLILAGKAQKGGEIERLRALAAQAGVSERVRLVGAVADMPAAYAAADLVIAPSTSPESFGRGVAEAGAMGRLVLASPLGGPAETIEDGVTGWLVAPGDAAAWAKAMENALATPAPVRAAMGRAARARIETGFSLNAMVEGTFAVYRRLADART